MKYSTQEIRNFASAYAHAQTDGLSPDEIRELIGAALVRKANRRRSGFTRSTIDRLIVNEYRRIERNHR